MIELIFIQHHDDADELNAFLDFVSDVFRVPQAVAAKLMAEMARSYENLFRQFVYQFHADHDEAAGEVYTIAAPTNTVVKLLTASPVERGNCTFTSAENAKQAIASAEGLLRRFKGA